MQILFKGGVTVGLVLCTLLTGVCGRQSVAGETPGDVHDWPMKSGDAGWTGSSSEKRVRRFVESFCRRSRFQGPLEAESGDAASAAGGACNANLSGGFVARVARWHLQCAGCRGDAGREGPRVAHNRLRHVARHPGRRPLCI